MTLNFDFVIVGGGAAGSVLANRLSADPRNSVCLVEAGGKGTSPLTWVPFGMLATIPGYMNNWSFRTVPQAHLNGRQMFQPRGRTLGGSTAINAMICTRGVPQDYAVWGVPGWAYEDLLPYFRKSEASHYGDSEVHGGDGPQPVNRLRSRRAISEAFLAAADTLQYPHRADFNDGEDTYGMGTYDVFQKNGERWSAARSYLSAEVKARPNLEIMIGTRFCNLKISEGRIGGLTVLKGRKRLELTVAREVILSGGAFGSPHMLQLAGIGDPKDLAAAGIEVRHALPGVGKNLSDHLDVKIHVADRTGEGTSLSPLHALTKLVPGIASYLRHRKGPLSTNFAEVGGFGKSGLRGDVSDLQFHMTCAGVHEHGKKIPLRSQGTLNICNLYPESRGTVRATSPNPLHAPEIDPAYLSDARDMAVMEVALTKGLQIVETSGFREAIGPVVSPKEGTAPQDHIRAAAQTIYHPAGTCKMGQDAAAVVDPRLSVHGLTGLRVVDASIMPSLNGGNTTAPTLAIAERAADLILSA